MSIITKDDLNILKAAFQLTCPDTLNLGFGEIYYGLTRAIRPKHIVVIGSKAGFAPIIFAKALKANKGHGISEVNCYSTLMRYPGSLPTLHFIDPGFDVLQEGSKAFGGEGLWKDDKRVKVLWEYFGVDDIVSHYRLTSREYLLMLDDIQPPEIDILYIDGDHSFQGVTDDLLLFHPYLSESAIVLAHDVHPDIDPSHGCGGYQAIHSLPEGLYQGSWLRILPGLAILQKLSINEPKVGMKNYGYTQSHP